ncbi:MAG: class I SAM-dependent methyltransferase [Myxococcales bacterium]|nr:class I SAM-dependent methyltransferase [Myxococcales bacterium]MCB9521974.1 class I SAM-dependent methyltransferase [Myxococcales bacterium]
MSEPVFYLSLSRARRHAPDAALWAAWLGAELVSRPLPPDRPGLVLTHAGLRLHVPGAKPTLWHPGLTHRRVRSRQPDTLGLVLALRPDEWVLDGTLGMGHDARMLARAGARVLGLEVRPAIATFTALGLHGLDPGAARRITVQCADHRTWLAAAPDDAVDHVYLDPMFPEGDEGESTNLAPFRHLPRLPRVSAATLRHALRVARRHVLLKLAPSEPAPHPEGMPPPELVGSKRQFYARWTTPASGALQSDPP